MNYLRKKSVQKLASRSFFSQPCGRMLICYCQSQSWRASFLLSSTVQLFKSANPFVFFLFAYTLLSRNIHTHFLYPCSRLSPSLSRLATSRFSYPSSAMVAPSKIPPSPFFFRFVFFRPSFSTYFFFFTDKKKGLSLFFLWTMSIRLSTKTQDYIFSRCKYPFEPYVPSTQEKEKKKPHSCRQAKKKEKKTHTRF